MTASTRLGLATVGIALLLGIAGDVLLRATSWGVDVTIWVTLLITGFWALRRVQTHMLTAVERGLVGCLLAFAACFSWRASTVLNVLDFLSLLTLLSLLASRTHPVPLLLSSAGRLLRNVVLIPLQAISGTGALLFRDITWSTIPSTGWSRYGIAFARGVAIAIPLLLVFGGLLAAADAVFSHFIGLAFRWDLTALIGHVAAIAVCAWLSAGLLRAWLWIPTVTTVTDAAADPPRIVLGMVETATVLGLLDLLFLAFVLIQMRYFFGGAALVQSTIGLTYAQYARQGFFEMVAVAVLVLPLLLGLHALQCPDDGRAQHLFRLLAGLQVGLLFVIMASSVERMHLYQNEYGLTELRFYTTAFMGWLSAVFLWFAATVLRGARPRFAFGALIMAFAAVFVLHTVNPDATIIRANVARVRAGHSFDTAYADGLSTDAVPALADALPFLSPSDRAIVTESIQQKRQSLRRQDWRSWTFSRQRVRDMK